MKITAWATYFALVGPALVFRELSVLAAPWERKPIPNDPCSTHEPLETNSLGCIFGPEGDALKVREIATKSSGAATICSRIFQESEVVP